MPLQGSGSVATIVRSFKSGVTRRAHQVGLLRGEHLWQRGYFEHVVRNEAALERICGYIATNPERWDMDHENPAHTERDEFDD